MNTHYFLYVTDSYSNGHNNMMGSPSDAIKGAVSGTGFLVGLIMVLLGLGVFALYAFRRYKKYVLYMCTFIYSILNEFR